MARASTASRRRSSLSAATRRFAHPYGLMLGASLAGALLQQRRHGAAGTCAHARCALSRCARGRPAADPGLRPPLAQAEHQRRRERVPPARRAPAGLRLRATSTPPAPASCSIPASSAPARRSSRSRPCRRPRSRRRSRSCAVSPAGEPLHRAAIAGLAFRWRCSPSVSCAARTSRARTTTPQAAALPPSSSAECAARPLATHATSTCCSRAARSRACSARRRTYGARRDSGQHVTFVNFDSVGGDAPRTLHPARGDGE